MPSGAKEELYTLIIARLKFINRFQKILRPWSNVIPAKAKIITTNT